MPGITDPQWDAIRRTAERTARRVAQEVLGQTVAANRASIPAGKPPRQDNDRFSRGDEGFTFFHGEWRRESQSDYELRMHYGPRQMPGSPLRVPSRLLEPCRVQFLTGDWGFPDLRSEAQKLFDRGYQGFSNKYRMIARIDRPDWLQVMAGKFRKSVADFYVREADGTITITDKTGRWGEHYAAALSLDKQEGIHPDVYNELKRLRAASGEDIRYIP